MSNYVSANVALALSNPDSEGVGGRFSLSTGNTAGVDLPHDSKKDLLISTSVSVTVIMLLFFFLRMYSRVLVLKTMRLDDWFIIPSMIMSVLVMAFICLNAKAGGGNHLWDIDLKNNLIWMVKV